ncbi:GntR family transcriptional regulator [Streptomyces sp. NPDC059618]|uniref:GntR family transcriptional regulator n=1 Tax=Streptomyces sp. NPDC059618 TaxID=3346887 RepID=UPI0036BD9319
MTKPSVRVYEDLRRSILTGEHSSGDWLREENIATTYEVSRTPVRDALRRLEADGLITLHPNRGAQVTGFDAADLDDIFSLRALLEGYAARRAAERDGSESERGELRALCDAMDEAARTGGDEADDRITELNMRFHRTLHRAAGNALLPGILSGVIEISLVRHTFHNYSPEEMERSLRQHRELVDALTARDGTWAQSVMTAHVLSARASLSRHTADQGSGD